ncbi:hypothetical protein CASFOL_021029 [Castilleja foliolosa]|uniref:protein-serine/threonine phosphatase n=1 Tax=Castilleja foliolosa TaxID=1961234 RepID=A0ABD3D6W8_9LAMI
MEEQRVDEGEISGSSSVQKETFSTKPSPPQVPPLKSSVNSNNNNNTGGGSGSSRVWTMRDLYKYQISSKTSYSGLYNLAWAQAVNNKPLGDVFVMMEDGTKANNSDGNNDSSSAKSTNGNEDNMVIDVDDEGEKEEGELEEGEIDLDSDLVVINKDSNVSEVVKSVDLIKEEFENLNVAIIADKPYDKLCSSLESTAVSLQKIVLGGSFSEKDTLVQLLLAAIKTLYSVLCSMTLTLKEQNKSVLLRLVAQVTSIKPLLFSPVQLKEVEAIRASLVSCADSFSNVNNHHDSDLHLSLDQTQRNSSLQYSKPSSAGVVSSRHKGLMVSLPLLDLHKDHDADSLPSPTRALSTNSTHSPFEHGLVKPEWPIPIRENQNPARMLHPYEKDAVKAVSSYQQKFSQRSYFMSDNLPSPTPSEDGDTTTGDGGDISGEVSSSIIQKVNNPAAVKNTLISLQQMVSSSYTEISNSSSAGLKPSSAKSRDPRLRLANLDARSQSLPDESKLEFPGRTSSRKHKSAEEQVSDGPLLKRQRNEFSAPNATLPLTSTTIPTTTSSPATLPLISQSEMLPVKNANVALSSLNSLLRDITVNPSVWMDILKMEHIKPADDIKSITQIPNSNTFLGTVPSTIGLPPFSMHGQISSSSSSSGAGIVQTPSQAVSAEEPGKVRMKPRDPRRIIHNSAPQKGVTATPDPSKINTKTLSTPLHADQLEKKSVSSSSSAKPPDIAKQFTSNLRNIAAMMSVSQESMPSSVLPQIPLQPVQVQQAGTETTKGAVVADSENRPPEAAIGVPPRPMNANAWSEVEHLFEGFDDQQKAAIQRERARRLDEQKKMFAERKLCLVLDLDHTLLNSAKFVEVDPLHDEMLRKKEEQDREKPHRHLFRFPHMSMWTKLRPGIWNFLEKASKLFEMHLYTMGNKYYATEMAKLIDPKGELFSGRVISRGGDGETFDSDDRIPKSKDLEGVLGMESAVVIVDDSVWVWPHNKLNLIAVERYIYFPCSRRQFGLPGPSLLEIDHDERPEDGTLASSLSVIERIHENFFGHQSLDEADVRNILASEQQKILAGCRVVFSRVFPVGEANPHMHPLWQTAEQFGAVCVNQIDDQVTHVVANSLGTDKVNWALSRGRFVVHPGWVEASALLYRRANELDFAIKQQ